MRSGFLPLPAPSAPEPGGLGFGNGRRIEAAVALCHFYFVILLIKRKVIDFFFLFAHIAFDAGIVLERYVLAHMEPERIGHFPCRLGKGA